METFIFDHLERQNVAYFSLYTNVSNSDEIRQRIVQASKPESPDSEREAVNFAFIDASLVSTSATLCYDRMRNAEDAVLIKIGFEDYKQTSLADGNSSSPIRCF
jgi:hypothetical protein